MDDTRKKIDEQWKEQVDKEKEALKNQPPEAGQEFIPPDPDFSFFVTTLALQASVSLGIIPNPATDKKEINLQQAKFLIDTLGMLQQKTAGNLTPEETKLFENLLYELRMQYINQTKSPQENL